MIIAHRGASGRACENSMDAFRRVVENGPDHADGIELDFHTTVDGALVVHHDPLLPGCGRISELTLDEVLAITLPDGSRVPLLADVLMFSNRVDLFCEAKGLPAAGDDELLRLIGGAPDSSRIHVHAFDHRIIARLHGKAPGGSYGALSSSYPLDPVRQVLDCGADRLWQEWPSIDRALVEECAAAGIGVVAWTVNDADAARWLRSLGVAALCGNWPDRLRPGA